MNTSRTEATWELQGNGRFELRRRLGSGGFGAVFEVFDRHRGAKVALKLLKRVEPEELYRFKQEFRALAGIAHPNLVQLYELLAQGDRWFFTMELVGGTSVLSFVRHGHVDAVVPTLRADALTVKNLSAPAPPMASAELTWSPTDGDEARLRPVLVQLVEGITALHRAGKIHRDIKPSNVLVTPAGRVVLFDFGLAVRLSRSAEMSRSTLVGTPGYIAPEIVMGQPATEASDWYAVGVLLYEAITGQLPFSGSLHEVLSQKIRHDAPAPSTVVRDVPPDLDRLCVELLSRSVEGRPSGAELLSRVGGSPAPLSVRREARFVGREAERAVVAQLFEEGPRRGRAAVALLGGPSGIGKSTLVAQVCAELRARARGAVILAGRCWEQESVPYKAIDGLVDPLSSYLKALPLRAATALLPPDVRTLVRLFPVLEQVEAIANAEGPTTIARDVHEIRRSAFRALRELLTRLAAARPLVLVIDDLHWGDQEGGALLVELLAPPDPPPLLLIASYRSEDVETSACLRVALPAFAAMRDESIRVASIELDALVEVDARTLARTLLEETIPGGADLAAAAVLVAQEAGGRPFHIRELVEQQGARARRGPGTSDGAISLDALVHARTAQLPDGARRLLEILAVAARPLDRAVAARAASLGEDEPAAYSALRNARLVRSRDHADHDEIEVYHDGIRETVVSHLGAERRRDAFRRLASALDDAGGADAETLAAYLLEGGDHARAAHFAVVAAEGAARALAFDRAAKLYRLALAVSPGDGADPAVRVLREALGEVLVTAGRGVEAAAVLTLAASAAPPEQAFELRRRAAEQLLFAGKVDEGMEALRRNLAEVGVGFPRGDAGVVVSFLLHLAWLFVRGFRLRAGAARSALPAALHQIDACVAAAKAFATVETTRGAYFSARGLTLALAAGDPSRAFEALFVFSVYGAALAGAHAAFVRRTRAALDALAPASRGPRARAQASLLSGVLAILDNELVNAREPLARASRLLHEDRADAAWELNLVEEFTFQCLLSTGALKELCERLPAALANARDRGNEHLVRALTLRFGHLPSLLADDPGGAAEILRAARAGWWPARFSTLDCFLLFSRGDVLLYAEEGRGPAARVHVEGSWKALARSPLLRVEALALGALNSRARVALGFVAGAGVSAADRDAALRTAEWAARRLRAHRNALSPPLAELVEAGVADARGDAPAALERFARADAALEAVGCPHYAAAARRRRGVLLGGEEGDALVAAADAFFRAQGARDPSRFVAVLAPGPRR